MKACLIIFITTFSCLISVNSWGQTATKSNSLNQKNSFNICANFTTEETLRRDEDDAPPPVRTLEDISSNTDTVNVSEEILYKQLGLIPSRDGSYVCRVKDPNNDRREYTLFKVKRIGNVLVASTFLDRGEFLTGQEQAVTDLFWEMIQFYTDIPEEYYSGINNYFQEFYSRMTDGRIKPSSDRVYAVDEPSSTVIMYHASKGEFQGTVLSLNIALL